MAARPTNEAMLTIRPPLPAASIGAQRPAAHQEQPVEIDADDAMPFRDREGVDLDAMREGVHAGVVDQDIEPAVGRERRFDGGIDHRRVADIDGAGDGVGQAGGDFRWRRSC